MKPTASSSTSSYSTAVDVPRDSHGRPRPSLSTQLANYGSVGGQQSTLTPVPQQQEEDQDTTLSSPGDGRRRLSNDLVHDLNDDIDDDDDDSDDDDEDDDDDNQSVPNRVDSTDADHDRAMPRRRVTIRRRSSQGNNSDRHSFDSLEREMTLKDRQEVRRERERIATER